jgi:hypothetical protein
MSERNAQLVRVLARHFGAEVTDLELLDRDRPDRAARRRLRLRLRRLDRRLARVGLRIADSGYRSHALLPAGATSANEELGQFGAMPETVDESHFPS